MTSCPHSLAVVVDSIERPEDIESGQSYEGKIQVMVSVYVERDSQKPIIIGRGAEHLVRVKKKLRTPVNRIVGGKAKLDLHVKVAKLAVRPQAAGEARLLIARRAGVGADKTA